MLPGAGSQRPALVGDGLVHSGDIQFDLGNRLGQFGDLFLERLTVRAGLRGARAQIRPTSGSGSAMVGTGYLHHLAGTPKSRRYPVQGRYGGASCFLDFRHRIC